MQNYLKKSLVTGRAPTGGLACWAAAMMFAHKLRQFKSIPHILARLEVYILHVCV